MKHSTEMSDVSAERGGLKVRQLIYADISPEIILESLTRTWAYSRRVGKPLSQEPVGVRARKRLSGVK